MKIHTMKKFLTTSLFLLIILPLIGQSKIDSLEQLIASSENDSMKYVWYNQLRRITSYTNPKKAKDYILKNNEILEKLGWERRLQINNVYLGNIYYGLDEREKALDQFINAESYFINADNLRDSLILGNVYNGMAAAYEQSNNDTIVMTYFTKAYDIFHALKDKRRQGIALNNIANIYTDRKEHRKAIELLKKAINELDDGSLYEYALIYKLNLSNNYTEIGQLDQSDNILVDILHNLEKESNLYTWIQVQKGLGSNQLLRGNYTSACSYLEKARDAAIENNFKILEEDIFYELHMAYKGDKKYKQALEALHSYNTINDSINSLERDKNLTDALQKFEAEKKDKEIQAATYAFEKQALQKRNLTILTISAFILALTALWFLYFKNKTNNLLSKQKKVIEQALAEKEILLKEIHHRVKNNLQVISSLLRLQSRTIDNQAAKSAILEGQNRVKSMALIHQSLYQKDITSINVDSYIKQLCNSLYDSYNILKDKVSMDIEVDPLELDVDTLIPLGLILNELISNALKHAFPNEKNGHIQINLKKKEDHILLQVKDDGVGIDPDKKSDSFGMSLIQAFSQKLDATMSFIKDNGTTANIEIRNFVVSD